MNFKKIRQFFDLFYFINNLKYKIINRFLAKDKSKKRIILQNSVKTDLLFKSIIKREINFNSIIEDFFSRDIFAYSRKTDREKILEFITDKLEKRNYKIFQIAENSLNKVFHIFERIIKFENDIRWHYSFFHDYSWPLIPSKNINIHPTGREIDVKYVWQLNRHLHLPYLGYAYYITHDENYAKEFKDQILDWISKNPPLFGINWYSTLEASVRMINWIFALYFFKESKEVNQINFFKKIFKSMLQHAYFIRHFHMKRSFNHIIGELFGLYLFSYIFNKNKVLKSWQNYAYEKLKLQILLQTRKDGTNIEQSVNYHRFVLEFFTLFLIINTDLEFEFKNQIKKMFLYLLSIVKPNRSYPLIGDFDDASILIINSFEDNLFKNLINLGTILFKNSSLKYLQPKLNPCALLLTGAKGLKVFESISETPPDTLLKSFPDAGYYCIRSSWKDIGNYVFIDFGRFGAQKAGHTHSSITHIVYSFQGKDILIDSGTFSYNLNKKERNFFRSSKAHNIIRINKANQAKIKSWFGWLDKPKLKRRIELSDDKIVFSCIHNGYYGYFVKREIEVHNEINYLKIKDIVTSKSLINKGDKYELELNFHFNPELELNILNKKLQIGHELQMEILSDEKLLLSLEDSDFSPRYGVKVKIKVLTIKIHPDFDFKKKIEILTHITPIEK